MIKMSYCLFAFMAFAASGSLHAAKINFCGELQNHYGPFDYRERASGKMEIVENAHFTAEVENGIKGTTGLIGGDIDYTLRAIPNHHRALATIGNISVRDKTVKVSGARYPTECYFERAIRFAPDDAVVRAAYGNYLSAVGKREMALTMFKYAVDLAPENPTFNYNLGLLYMKSNNYEKAAEYADKAYSLGFPLPGLRNQLAAARKGAPNSK
jgi:tetratricopeptide (TPR) repeat protein